MTTLPLQASGASVDPAGRVAILLRGTPGRSCQAMVEKWDLAGARRWSRSVATCSASGFATWTGLAVDAQGHHVRVAGGLEGTVDLGTGPVTSRGGVDDLVLDLWP